LHTQYLIDEKDITPGKKKLLTGDEKCFWALKRHGLSADEKNFGTHHLSLKLNTLAILKNYKFHVAPN
jgi:hypothetical protein